MSLTHTLRLLFAAFCSACIISCGGGGGSSAVNSALLSPGLATQKGNFIDSAVTGIGYKTATQNGVTDEFGGYIYVSGEQVTFSIGAITLPPVTALSTVTPLSMSTTGSLSDPVVTNVAYLLQSIDSNNNPNDGILIDSRVASLATTNLNFNQSSTDFAADPAVKSLTSFIGVDGGNTSLNSGRYTINLVPKEERDDSLEEILKRLDKLSLRVSGLALYLQPVQDLTIEDRVARTQYRFLMNGPSEKDLSVWSKQLIERLKNRPEVSQIATDLQDLGLQAYLQIDRDAASRFGVSMAAIDNVLYDAFGQRLVSTIFTQSNQYRVVLEVGTKQGINLGINQSNNEPVGPALIEKLFVPGLNAQQIPLSSIAKVIERQSALSVMHVGQFPAVTLSFAPNSGYALGEAVQAIREETEELSKNGMPQSIETQFQGAALAFQNSLLKTIYLLLAAIVTMYIVLGVLYESYIHPVTILSTLPSAALGALIALMISGHDLNVIAVIGIVLLIGIVKKNAIMMIDFALDAQREQGMSAKDAIYNACLLRFRPILMTTLCAMLGALPLMLGTGMGSELRHPLGITMVGGLILSQLLTLFTTPVIYLTFVKWTQKRTAVNERVS